MRGLAPAAAQPLQMLGEVAGVRIEHANDRLQQPLRLRRVFELGAFGLRLDGGKQAPGAAEHIQNMRADLTNGVAHVCVPRSSDYRPE